MKSNEENLSDRIKDWLEKQGQSLEMRVAKSFRENGFEVSQFEYFVDEETQNIRQTDVTASISKHINNTLITVSVIIECKYAKAKPWVILVTQQKFDRFSFFGRMLSGKHPSEWKSLPSIQGRLAGKIALTLDKAGELEIFEINPAGYAIMEARLDTNYKPDPNQQDYAYEAVMQVTKSIYFHDRKNEEIFRNIVKSFEDGFGTGDDFSPRGLSPTFGLDLNITIPLIVINGRLFESRLNEQNEIEVSEIENGYVLMPHKSESTKSKSVPLSPVMITTENNFNVFILRIRNIINTILEQEKAITELIEFEESKIKPAEKTDF